MFHEVENLSLKKEAKFITFSGCTVSVHKVYTILADAFRTCPLYYIDVIESRTIGIPDTGILFLIVDKLLRSYISFLVFLIF